MREIEVKIKIEDQKQIVSKLGELGIKLTEKINQHDEVFTNDEFEKNKGCLRIRSQNNKTILTYKRSKTEGNELDSIEKEVEATDPKELKEILLLSGFETYSIVEKERIQVSYNGYTICIDSVKELGDFIEVEKVVEENQNADSVESEILDFLENTLKVDTKNRIYKGYDNLILEKNI